MNGWKHRPSPLRVALMQWSGQVGGAEVLGVELAHHLRLRGVDARAAFVGDPEPIARLLEQRLIPHRTLGLSRGRHVVTRPRALARLLGWAGEDVSLLPSDGYLAAAARIGGYRGQIVAVEHGSLLMRHLLPMTRRVVRELDSASGLWAVDAQVAVSDYALRQVAARRHARTLLRIYNGIDLERFTLSDCTGSEEDRPVTIGFVGRLIADKGAGVLLRALAQMRVRDAVVRIAGDGPERVALEQLAVALGIAHRAEFLGEIFDVASFWHRCDIAAVPSHVPWVESFGLVAVEAMACGCAVVVSASGALPEIVSSGLTGTVVPENDPAALATALDEYATNRVLRAQHGQQARMDCERRFAIVDCAREYEELFHSLLDSEDRYPRTARLPKIHGHPPVRWTRGR